MSFLFAVSVIMIIILLFQVSPLAIKKEWRDLGIYMLFWTAATAHALLVTGRVPVPTVNQLLIDLVKALYQAA